MGHQMVRVNFDDQRMKLTLSTVSEGVAPPPLKTPDGGCLGVVLRTGFGTAQGQLVRVSYAHL